MLQMMTARRRVWIAEWWGPISLQLMNLLYLSITFPIPLGMGSHSSQYSLSHLSTLPTRLHKACLGASIAFRSGDRGCRGGKRSWPPSSDSPSFVEMWIVAGAGMGDSKQTWKKVGKFWTLWNTLNIRLHFQLECEPRDSDCNEIGPCHHLAWKGVKETSIIFHPPDSEVTSDKVQAKCQAGLETQLLLSAVSCNFFPPPVIH